jgi:hypothetical protein
MARLRRRDGEDSLPQLWLFEPPRNQPLEDSRPARTQPSSRNDEHATSSRIVGSRYEGGERAMRLGLRHPMQVKSRLNFMLAALEPLGIGAIDPGKAVERLERP